MVEIIYTLVMTHITIIFTTLYLHRGITHRAIEFHPLLEHFMRFWLWLTTGMTSKQWVAVHRLHHQYTDIEGDPHSPKILGLARVLLRGTSLYWRSAAGLYPLPLNPVNQNFSDAYGAGTPDDWIEQKLYTPHSSLGIILMLVINLVLFGLVGLLVWVVQMIYLPLTAAGAINGLSHSIGYRNHDTNDNSTNTIPWGIVIGGEELHNNHHKDPANPKFSYKSWEFDIGWMYICILRFFGLAKLREQ